MSTKPSLHSVVALLSDVPEHNLSRGQVGTVIELLDSNTALVEFSDDDGRAYAITPVKWSQVLLLHYEPEAA
ncbi:MAG: DUF4926 domain-containing protein [Aestuariivirga sp.]